MAIRLIFLNLVNVTGLRSYLFVIGFEGVVNRLQEIAFTIMSSYRKPTLVGG